MNRILLITSTLPWPLRRNGGGQRTSDGVIVGRYVAAAMQGGVGTAAAGDVAAVLDFDDMEWQMLEAQLAHQPWPGLKGKLGAAMALREVRRLCYSSLRLFNHL